MTDLDNQLAELWGDLASHSEYQRGDVIRYRTPTGEYTGTILWITGPSESRIEGHEPLPMRYIVERQGWTGFPDVVYSSDIDSLAER